MGLWSPARHSAKTAVASEEVVGEVDAGQAAEQGLEWVAAATGLQQVQLWREFRARNCAAASVGETLLRMPLLAKIQAIQMYPRQPNANNRFQCLDPGESEHFLHSWDKR